MKKKSIGATVVDLARANAERADEMRRQRDTYQARLVERTEEVDKLNTEANSLYTRLAEAERHREVMANSEREVLALLALTFKGQPKPFGITACEENIRAALRECGILRPQDDPAMIPAAWLPGAEEEEG